MKYIHVVVLCPTLHKYECLIISATPCLSQNLQLWLGQDWEHAKLTSQDQRGTRNTHKPAGQTCIHLQSSVYTLLLLPGGQQPPTIIIISHTQHRWAGQIWFFTRPWAELQGTWTLVDREREHQRVAGARLCGLVAQLERCTHNTQISDKT